MTPDQIVSLAWAIAFGIIGVAWAIAWAARGKPVSINVVTDKQVKELTAR